MILSDSAQVWNLSQPTDATGWRKSVTVPEGFGVDDTLCAAAEKMDLPDGTHRLAVCWSDGELAIEDVVVSHRPSVSSTRVYRTIN